MPSIVSSHPGKQVFVYQAVLAFQKSGWLIRHFAATYYKADFFPYKLVNWLPSTVQKRTIKELKKRQLIQLDQQLITSFPYVEMILTGLKYVKPLARTGIFKSDYRLVNLIHDLMTSYCLSRMPPPTIFYSFQGVALHSIKTAHKRGSIVIFDSTHPLSHVTIVKEEYARQGFKTKLPSSDKEIREALSADYHVTASQLSTQALIDVGIPSERIFQIPYGVDLEQFHPRPELRSDKIFRVLYVGKISVHKGFHFLLEAWQNLNLPNSELILVGKPAQPFDLTVLKRFNSKMYRWIQSVDDIHLLFSAADVFVLPSLVEGFGMVTLEAMASGLPVIVTENAKMVARDGLDGFVIPIRNVEALQDCILRLYKDASLRKAIGMMARKRAEEYNWHRYQTTLIETLNRIVCNRY